MIAEAWFEEFLRWQHTSRRDQISLPFAVWVATHEIRRPYRNLAAGPPSPSTFRLASNKTMARWYAATRFRAHSEEYANRRGGINHRPDILREVLDEHAKRTLPRLTWLNDSDELCPYIIFAFGARDAMQQLESRMPQGMAKGLKPVKMPRELMDEAWDAQNNNWESSFAPLVRDSVAFSAMWHAPISLTRPKSSLTATVHLYETQIRRGINPHHLLNFAFSARNSIRKLEKVARNLTFE